MRMFRLGPSIILAAVILAAAYAWGTWYRVEHSSFRQCLQAAALALKAQGEPADTAPAAAVEMCTGVYGTDEDTSDGGAATKM
jgi:hypothetical protein